MEKLLLKLTDLFAQAPGAVLRFKVLVLSSLIAVSIAMGFAIANLTVFNLSSESFMQEDSPAQLALEEFRRQFGSDRSVFIIYEPADGDVFSRKSLTELQKLTNDLENWQELDPKDFPDVDLQQLLHIRRVQSLANLLVQTSVDDTLSSSRILPKQLPETQSELDEIKTRALAEKDYVSGFYAMDGSFAAILLQTDFGTVPVEGYESAINDTGVELDASFDDFDLVFDEQAVVQEVEFEDVDPRVYFAFNDALTAVYDQYGEQFEFYPVGEPSLMTQMQGILDQLIILGYLMVLIFAILLWVLFRSASALFWPLLTIALSVAWCWGFTVLLGLELSSMIGLTVLLIFSVGIADCVHVMSAY
ncbi:MMPL family transporter, partial [Porticoccaceae bacterium]|nr:MMPL family transporter [Porticoccaceae bacterium]